MKNTAITSLQVGIITFKDENVYHVYCPSLNLIGCGYTEKEADESFNIVFDEYIKYTTENNTLIEDLKSCGWKINGSKKLSPPKISESMTLDSDFVNIVNNYDFVKRSIHAKIPIV